MRKIIEEKESCFKVDGGGGGCNEAEDYKITRLQDYMRDTNMYAQRGACGTCEIIFSVTTNCCTLFADEPFLIK